MVVRVRRSGSPSCVLLIVKNWHNGDKLLIRHDFSCNCNIYFINFHLFNGDMV